MCGILGSFGNPANAEAIIKRVTLGLDKLNHRGPNGAGIEKFQLGNSFEVLAHSRLSIIDLSSDSAQPTACESGRWVISFNGEIYNNERLRKIEHGDVPFSKEMYRLMNLGRWMQKVS